MAKWQKLGVVLRGDKGPFLILGDLKNKDSKYQYTVELIVKDSKGEVVHTVQNPLISLSDPRSRPGITEEQRARISDKLRYEAIVKTE